MSEAWAESQQGAEVEDLTPAALLAELRSERRAEEAAAARQLLLAATWADLHPPESIHPAAAFSVPAAGREHVEAIAGQGCPLVAEFCVAELGAVLGVSTAAAKRLIGHALELRHRLPRLWVRVHAGAVPAWRARRVAEATIHATPALTPEAAAWVDAQVAGLAGKVGPAQLDRLVAEAIARHHLADGPDVDPDDPDAPWSDDGFGIDPRHVTVHDDHVHYRGTIHLEGDLDLADGLDVDHALSHKAAVYKALGSTESLGARRARALGELARLQTALDLTTTTGAAAHTSTASPATEPGGLAVPAEQPEQVAEQTAQTRQSEQSEQAHQPEQSEQVTDVDAGVKLPAARQLVLHAHFDAATAAADGSGITFAPTGRLEEGQRLLLLDQVKAWCGATGTHVVIRPVIDLNTRLETDAYEVPDRIRETVVLRDRTCVFPWCTRPARRCQVDHVIPHDPHAEAEGRPQPGPTATDNLAPLCTRHHRLKTHGSWRYRSVGPGCYEWTSPHGHTYRRDPTGTTPLPPGRGSPTDVPDPADHSPPRRRRDHHEPDADHRHAADPPGEASRPPDRP